MSYGYSSGFYGSYAYYDDDYAFSYSYVWRGTGAAKEEGGADAFTVEEGAFATEQDGAFTEVVFSPPAPVPAPATSPATDGDDCSRVCARRRRLRFGSFSSRCDCPPN